MDRTRSRRSRGFLQACRRWAPWIAQLALAASLNIVFDGPVWADEIGRHRALEASLVDAERFPAPPSPDELVTLLTPALERALAPYRDPHPLAPSPTRTPAPRERGATQVDPISLSPTLSPGRGSPPPSLAVKVGFPSPGGM
jgi:hypothetical protein